MIGKRFAIWSSHPRRPQLKLLALHGPLTHGQSIIQIIMMVHANDLLFSWPGVPAPAYCVATGDDTSRSGRHWQLRSDHNLLLLSSSACNATVLVHSVVKSAADREVTEADLCPPVAVAPWPRPCHAHELGRRGACVARVKGIIQRIRQDEKGKKRPVLAIEQPALPSVARGDPLGEFAFFDGARCRSTGAGGIPLGS
jgi:hypothetical protein